MSTLFHCFLCIKRELNCCVKSQAAFKLYQQASDMVEGALCAARCHEHGNGTKVDLYKAEYLYQRVRP